MICDCFEKDSESTCTPNYEPNLSLFSDLPQELVDEIYNYTDLYTALQHRV